MSEHLFLHDLPAYALGALAPGERARIEAHLADGCAICEMELTVLQAAVARLPYALPSPALPAGLKQKLLSRLAAESAAPAASAQNVVPLRRPSRTREVLALAAAAAFAAALGGVFIASRGRIAALKNQTARLEKQNETLRSESARARSELLAKEKDVAWLHDPRVQVALLKGLKDTAQAKAKLLWNPGSHQGVLYVDGLPPLPLEKSYELWVFVKDEPVPAGTFGTRVDGTGVVDLARLESLGGEPKKFAVSVEPKGGVPKPTGAIVLVGERL